MAKVLIPYMLITVISKEYITWLIVFYFVLIKTKFYCNILLHILLSIHKIIIQTYNPTLTR